MAANKRVNIILKKIDVLDVVEISYFLTYETQKTTMKILLFLSEFPDWRFYLYRNSGGSRQERAIQRLQIRIPATFTGGLKRAHSLAGTQSFEPSAVSSILPTIKGGAPSGPCIHLPPSSLLFPTHTYFPEPLYPVADFSFLGPKAIKAPKLARKGDPNVSSHLTMVITGK